jgi:hypothetical protein
MKHYGKAEVLVTDKLRSYGAAMKVIGNANKQETGRWLNNRGENSHQPFRRRERAMRRFRSMRSLQKFTAVQASLHNHFNLQRQLYSLTISSSTAPLLSRVAPTRHGIADGHSALLLGLGRNALTTPARTIEARRRRYLTKWNSTRRPLC